MSDYNWCHGPDCHTYTTQSRVRGSKGNKVLRTMRIKKTKWNEANIYGYFCNQHCLHGFLNHHLQSIVAIAPRREALETPIKVVKNKYESYRYEWNGEGGTERVPYMATKTIIKSVDND